MKRIIIIVFALLSLLNLSAQTNDANQSNNKQRLFYLLPSERKIIPSDNGTEQMPEFPGGQEALARFYANNLKYPVIAQENGIQGTTQVELIVEQDGSLSNITVKKSSGDSSLDREALRLIRSMPKWNPGKQNGLPARMKISLPVKFKLN